MESITSIGGIILTIGGILTLVVLGVLYLIGIYKKGKDSEDDRLIKILEGTVNALDKKVEAQKKEHDEIVDGLTKRIDQLADKVEKLTTENHTLRDVLQGRDEATQKFYEQAFQAMKVSNETHALVKQMVQVKDDTNVNIKALIDLISKQMGVTETTAHAVVEAAKLLGEHHQ